MASTSLSKDIAVDFAIKSAAKTGNHCVLFELEYPGVCYTAIDLNEGGSLSKYSYEKEVLLLPGTLFEVGEVSENGGNNGYKIRLENVLVPWKVLKKALDELHKA